VRSRIALMPLWNYGKWVLICLCIIAFTSGCGASLSGVSIPKANHGVIDLRSWSWDKQGIVPLNGQWKFKWYIASQQKGTMDSDFAASTLEVPGTWGSMRTGSGYPLNDQGYGIYNLLILHQIQSDMMAIRLPNISTAYELSIDGRVVVSRGRVDRTASKTVPFQLPAIVYFRTQDMQTELQLVVANFDHRRGGIRTELVMGNEDQIQKLQIHHAAQELIVLGCLIMISFYHLGLFILRRKEVANILFAMLCLFVGLRMGLIGEGFIVQWLPAFTWDLATRLEYISFVMSGWTGFGYFQAMYPQEIKRIWFKISSLCAAVLLLSVVTFPPLIFSSWILAFQLYILLFSVRIVIGLVVSRIRRRVGATLALIGIAGFIVTIVNDMLFYNGWWRSIDLVPFGLLFLIVMNSFIISLRFSQTYDRAEKMSVELIEWNNSLETRIAQRTDELYQSNITLAAAKTELERMEYSRRELISNISHDLRTPMTLLQGYLEALRDNVIVETKQRDNTIRLMLSKVEGLNSLIQDLFDISVLEDRKVDLSFEDIPVTEWKERLMEQYSLEMKEIDIRFACEVIDDSVPSSTVAIDIHRMDRVFANLLYNAIRYTPKGGSITITMKVLQETHSVKVIVADSGVGIEPDDLPHIFDRFYKKDKSRHSSSGGSGLGLSIAKEIIGLHGGEISAYNPPEGGSVFEMLFPLSG
jgi:signal transduction histidine kinase